MTNQTKIFTDNDYRMSNSSFRVQCIRVRGRLQPNIQKLCIIVAPGQFVVLMNRLSTGKEKPLWAVDSI